MQTIDSQEIIQGQALSEVIDLVSCDFRKLGPDIDPAVSNALQGNVASQLLNKTHDVILASAEKTTEEAFKSLTVFNALSNLSAERQKLILLHPTFRYWLQAMRRTSR